MIIWKIGFTLEFDIISLIPHFGFTPMLLKSLADGRLNIKIGKLNTQTIFKIMRECSSLYRILAYNVLFHVEGDKKHSQTCCLNF